MSPSEPEPAGETSVGVLVVDDQEPFRRALRELIDATPGCHLVGETASGEDAIAAVDALSPRLVVIDKRMPGIGGLEATRRLTRRHPELVVVLVSVEDPGPDVAAACGAAVFVRKRDLSVGLTRDLVRRMPRRR